MVKKKSITTKNDDDNINVENNIKINIDLNDLKPKRKKRSNKKKPKPLENPLGQGGNQSSTPAPRKMGTKIFSNDTDFNPNNTTNMIISSALQNAFGGRPNFQFNPIAPPQLPAPPPQSLLPAPPPQPAITWGSMYSTASMPNNPANMPPLSLQPPSQPPTALPTPYSTSSSDAFTTIST